MKTLQEMVPLGIVLFASTNVDDVFVLLGFFSDSAFRPRHVVFGQYIGIAGLYVVSVVAALIAFVISPVYVGMLGIAPIAIGARKLWNFRLEQTETESERNLSGQTPRKVVAVAAVTLANGGDNLGTYIPVFAT